MSFWIRQPRFNRSQLAEIESPEDPIGHFVPSRMTITYMEQTIVTKSFEETQKVGEEFVKRLCFDRGSASTNGSIVLALYGDLGSGKTTFVQGLAKGLGIQKRIISPTFIIMRTYEITSYEFQIKNFYHIDLYRTESAKDTEGLGIKELLQDPQNILAIEWSEKLGSLLPQKRWDICFRYMGENQRKIMVNIP